MKNYILIALVLIVLIGIGGFYFINKNKMANMQQTSGSESAATNQVEIKNMAFSPTTIKIKVGDTVTWINQDSTTHTATADDNSWDTGNIASSANGKATFTKAGTFTYHCSFHTYMTGTVIVE